MNTNTNTKDKITKHTIPSDFTLSLAIVDIFPVLFFLINTFILGYKLQNYLFIIGSTLIFIAGASKVIWKFIVVIKKKNVWLLFIQMRFMMPIGFVLIILSLILFYSYNYKILIYKLFEFPQLIFFIIAIVLMLSMIVFAFVLNNKNKKNNWIEQITNSLSQLFFLLSFLFL